jgi:hypothetical protein
MTAVALAGAGCGSHSSPKAAPTTTTPPTTAAPSTTATAAPPAPPTTAWAPSAPQPSPSAAADQFINAWANGERAAAGMVASPTAVATLFATPYPGEGLAISRGCTDTLFPPVVCTYGPPGGANPNDAIYQVSVAHQPRGWYVTDVTVLP